jgi:hypothetical protein
LSECGLRKGLRNVNHLPSLTDFSSRIPGKSTPQRFNGLGSGALARNLLGSERGSKKQNIAAASSQAFIPP